MITQGGTYLVALALSGAVEPDRWHHLGGRHDTYEEYLDRDSVQRSGDKVIVWTRRDFVGDEGTAWHEIELDCSTRTETLLAFIRDDRGIISHNVVRPHRGSLAISSGSVEEKIFNIACAD